MLSVFRCLFLGLSQGRCIFPALMLMGLVGCTSMGSTGLPAESSDLDLGPRVELRVCVYKDVNVSDKRAASIIAAIQKEFDQYGLIVNVPSIREWRRPAFSHEGILRDIAKRPLEPPFDRNFALVSRNAGDFAWGFLLPEVLGAVETRTHTKGYTVAEMGSLNQLLTFNSPHDTAVHEFYHMLGVAHGDGRRVICEKITRLKQLALENRQSGRDFFPGISSKGKVYLSRNAVDRRFGLVPRTTVVSLRQR